MPYKTYYIIVLPLTLEPVSDSLARMHCRWLWLLPCLPLPPPPFLPPRELVAVLRQQKAK